MVKNRAVRIRGAKHNITNLKRVENALCESEEKFKYVFDHSVIGKSITLPSGEINVNRTFCEMLGYSSEELQRKKWQEITHPDDIKLTQREIDSLLSGEKDVVRFNKRYLKKDGSVIWLDLSSSLRRDEAGKPLYLMTDLVDITERKQVEKELTKSEDKFRTIFDNSSDGMFIVDLKARKFFMCNTTCAKMLGYTQDEFLNLDIADIHPKEDVPFIYEQIGKFSRGEEGIRSDLRFKRKNGSIFTSDLSPALLTIAEKEYLLINFTDITERKLAEDALRESEKRFRALIENSSDAITLLDAKGRAMYDSPAAPGMLGYAPEEWIGREVFALIHPDDLPKTQDLFQKLVETPGACVNSTFRVHHKSGSWLWLEMVATNLLDEPGVKAIVLNYRDITEQVQAEEALNESKLMFHMLIESLPQNIYAKDVDDRFVFANQHYCAIQGKTLEEIVGKTDFELHPPDLAEKYRADDRQVIETGKTIELVEEHQALGGEKFFVQVIKTPLYDSKGQTDGTLGIFWDITERKQAEETLRQAEEKYRSIFENAVEGIYQSTPEGCFITANPALARMWGYESPQELIASITDIARQVYIDPNHRAGVLRALEEHGEVRHVESQTRKKDGSTMWVSENMRAVRDSNGTFTYEGTFEDITERKQAEGALHESEERFRVIFEKANDAIHINNDDDEILAVNSRMCELMGYSREELLKMHIADLQAPEIRQHGSVIKNELARHGSDVFEGINLHRDGQRIPVEISVGRIELPSGDMYISVVRDITERKRAEVALRESEERFTKAFRSIPDALVISRLEDGKIVEVNDSWHNVFGYSREEVIGKSSLALNLFADPAERQRAMALLREQGFVRDFELQIRQKSGALRTAILSIELQETQGEQYLLTVIQDVTERKRMEDILVEERNLMRTLIDNIPDRVFVKDAESRIVMDNIAHRRMLGATTLEQVKGRTDFDFFPREIAAPFIADEEQIIRSGEAMIDREEFSVDKDGKRSLFLTTKVPLRDYQGIVTGIVGINHDITDLKQAERDIHLMSDTQGEIVRLDNLTDIYHLVGEKIQELVGDGYVSISMLDDKIQAMKIVGLYGFGGLYKKLVRRFKVDPSRIVYALKDMTDDEVRIFRSGKLEKVEGGLYTMFTRKVPKSICDLAEKQLKISGIYAMGFIGQGIHYGGLTLLAKSDIAPYKDMIETIMNQAAITIKRIRAEEEIRRQVAELETLYESGLALNQLLSTKEIGQKIIELLEQKMDWHHSIIRLYNPQDETLELLAFNQPGLNDQKEHLAVEKRFQTLISKPSDGLSGWAVLNSQIVRSGDVSHDPRYLETFPGLHSGLYVPMKSGEKTIGVISIESEVPNVFSDADERLVATLANQAAGAFENARLYQTAQQEITERKRIENLLAGERNQLASRVQKRTADLNRVNLDLARAIRVKDDFLASMSHELRTPLTGILGLSEALQLKTYGELNDRQQKILGTIEESGRHLQDLINDILDLSKIEAGKLDLQFASCSLADICKASLQLTKGMAQQKGLNVQYTPAAELVIVRADARRLKQILVNLLGNAIKFTPENGELGLEVQANKSERKVKLTVWDKGIGIKPEDLHKLFKPFIQLDSGLSRQYSGTGLGLSLVQRLTELHNGGIEVESNIGEGSRFTVILPWSPLDTTPIPYISKRGTGGLSSSVMSLEHSKAPLVMLADDNEMILHMVTDFLDAKQYRVIKARSGAELLERAAEFHPDIMLVDIQMPDMDGLETIRRIRSHADPLIAAAPVIAVTALAMPGDRENCLRAGANKYMSKPLRLIELVAAIQNLLEDKR